MATAAKPRVVQSTDVPVSEFNLFVGVDAFLTIERELVEVRKFDGDRAVLATSDETTRSVARDNGFQFKMCPKVSRVFLNITELQGKEAYSAWTDPAGQWMNRQMALSGHYDDQMTKANSDYAKQMNDAAVAQRLEESGFAPEFSASSESLIQQAETNYSAASAALSNFNNTSEFAARMNTGKDGEAQPRDSVHLTFSISSPEPIADAHAIARVRIRTEKEGYRDISFQRAIGDLGPSPRSVLMTLDGLPPGFEYVSTDLHIFHQGEEFASNQSERRIPLSASEVREYLLLDHLAQHRGADVPASPVWSLAPPSLCAINNGSALDFPALVQIDEQGQATAIKASGDQILPDHARSILAELSYLPALHSGEPVSSEITVNLADYFR